MRGSNVEAKVTALRRLVRKYKPMVVGIQETKRSIFSMKLACLCWGSNAVNFSSIAALGNSGGLAILWDPDRIHVLEIIKGGFTISLKCIIKGVEGEVLITNIYGPIDSAKKTNFWDELKRLYLIGNFPTVHFGDFNAVRNCEERSSGLVSGRERKSFNNYFIDCEMLEFVKEGCKFSFSNKQAEPTLSKLNRFTTNISWFDLFPGLVEVSLGFYGSDHRVLILKPYQEARAGPKPFRFQPHWFDHHELMAHIRDWWVEFSFFGNPGFVLHKKLKELKIRIKHWVKQNLSKVENRIEKLEMLLQNLETEEEIRELQPSEVEKKHYASLELRDALLQEETLWSTKAKNAWREKGDKCTGYFHRMVKARVFANSITSLLIENKKELDPNRIREHAEDFFQKLYSENITNRPRLENLGLKCITVDQAEGLQQPFKEDELLGALKELAKDKTPGPDGYSVRFFLFCWDFMKFDILKVFDEFYSTGSFDWRLNTSFITLIPKKSGDKAVHDYRPISLLSCIYKLLSKVLDNRLGPMLASLVSELQSASIQGRQIQDATFIANELIDTRKH